jgi:hypothetical protein
MCRIAQMKIDADIKADALPNKAEIEAGNIRVREEGQTSRCIDNNGISRLIVTRGENHYEVVVARDRDDIELQIERGEHVIKVGRGRHEVEVVNTSQSGYRTFDERQDFVEGFGSTN